METKKHIIRSPFSRQSWVITLMKQAEIVSNRSSCLKKKVGAIIAKCNNNNYEIIGQGYNGTYPGQKECHDYWREIWLESKLPYNSWLYQSQFAKKHAEWSIKNELHAEVNAIASVAKSNNSTRGTILVTTYSPCDQCTKIIIANGIAKVYYKFVYCKGLHNISILNNFGILCEQVLII